MHGVVVCLWLASAAADCGDADQGLRVLHGKHPVREQRVPHPVAPHEHVLACACE